MRTILFSLLTGTLLLSQHASMAQQNESIAYTFLKSEQGTAPTATISQLNCSIDKDKARLEWSLSSNELADRLIVQRSKDGKKFEMVGLVFGTDKQETDSYQFFEKWKGKKCFYRIIIIHKDETVSYSPVVQLQAGKRK